MTDTPKITIIADEPDYLVVNKPAGLLTHPTEAKEPDTLVAQVLALYPNIMEIGESPERPGIVHRLDKEASGLLVIAKTQAMFDALKKQFQERSIEKEYLVLTHGSVAADHAVIDFPIGRGSLGRMAARPNREESEGKDSVTEFMVEKRFTRFTLLRVNIHTGRTHQIRVHMFAYNHPVVGDTVYMTKKLNLKRDKELGRLFLHSARLCFDNLAGERMCYESPMPEELQNFLSKLK